MSSEKIKVLIVGSGITVSALARKFAQYEYVEKIYATGGCSEICEIIDIRDNDLTELLMFVLENNIDLTIPISETALESDIVSFFQSNGQNIFGPTRESCDFILNKISCKKFLYKIQAKTPKFGMFNKAPQISDYLKNSAFPVIIRTTQGYGLQDEKMVCTTMKNSLDFIDKLFLKGEQDILIEDYVYGHNFTVYFITDGYSAIPLNIVGNYKFLENNGGTYTQGCGCYCPDYKVTKSIFGDIQNIVLNILHNLDNKGCTYTGIIGLECILLPDGNFVVSDVNPFLQNHDARAVLNLCEDDLIKIFTSCINGSFSDEYESIKTNDYSSVSLSIYAETKEEEIIGIDNNCDIDLSNLKCDNDKYYSCCGINFTLTKTASTISEAKRLLAEEIEDIKFKGMKYLKAIFDQTPVK